MDFDLNHLQFQMELKYRAPLVSSSVIIKWIDRYRETS